MMMHPAATTSGRVLSKYLGRRHGSNSWAQRPDVVAAWRREDLAGVPPLCLEFSPVLDCNADCPLCPFRRSRIRAGTVRLHAGDFVRANGTTIATPEVIRCVLDRAAQAGVTGTIWTGGGEPTLLKDLAEWCAYAARLGMDNALYTNGFLLGVHPELAEHLLAPEAGMVFIRVSVNAVTEKAVRQHWGVKDAGEVLHQLAGLEGLLGARERLRPRFEALGRTIPSIQISTIIDHKNADDLLPICRTIAGIFGRHPYPRGEEDVMIVRPLTDHRKAVYGCDDHSESEIRQILSVAGRGGPGRRIVEEAGLSLFLGFGLDLVDAGAFPSYADVIRAEYQQRDHCWAHGLFLTVGPDGGVYPCTEMNCDQDYVLGNLTTQSVEDIYRSGRRMDFLRIAEESRWGPALFQPFSRTTRLDRIAKAVLSGELGDDDIERIRQESLKSHHLLLN